MSKYLKIDWLIFAADIFPATKYISTHTVKGDVVFYFAALTIMYTVNYYIVAEPFELHFSALMKVTKCYSRLQNAR